MDEINVIWPSWHTVELIGSGSFGKVYKVKREEIGNISYGAVKVMHIPSDESEIRDLQHSGMEFHSIRSYFEDMVKNLMNEIQIMESLKSANNIVGIEDYQVIPKTEGIGWDIYIRMELLTDLGTWLASHEMSVQDVVKLGMDICSALVACEKVHIIHRDIKIDNVFINQFGSFKLGDFGISKQLEKTRSAVSQKGTNMYMAPEVFRGEHYNKTVDIYSLGILLYRLLNQGRFPFMPPQAVQIYYEDSQKAMQRRLSGEAIPPIPDVPSALSDIIAKACDFRRELRYQSAGEMYQVLSDYKGQEERKLTTDDVLENDRNQSVTKKAGDDLKGTNRKMEYMDEETMAAFGKELDWDTIKKDNMKNKSKDCLDKNDLDAIINREKKSSEQSVKTQKTAEPSVNPKSQVHQEWQTIRRSNKHMALAMFLSYFLGMFGAQNWYLGRKKLAWSALGITLLGYILACAGYVEWGMTLVIIPVFWGMFDAVCIATGYRKDGRGNYVMTKRQRHKRKREVTGYLVDKSNRLIWDPETDKKCLRISYANETLVGTTKICTEIRSENGYIHYYTNLLPGSYQVYLMNFENLEEEMFGRLKIPDTDEMNLFLNIVMDEMSTARSEKWKN